MATQPLLLPLRPSNKFTATNTQQPKNSYKFQSPARSSSLTLDTHRCRCCYLPLLSLNHHQVVKASRTVKNFLDFWQFNNFFFQGGMQGWNRVAKTLSSRPPLFKKVSFCSAFSGVEWVFIPPFWSFNSRFYCHFIYKKAGKENITFSINSFLEKHD